MNDRIRIIKYEQAADEKVSLGGIKWQRKWDVCVQCDSLEEAERVRAALAQPEQEPVAWEFKANYIQNPHLDDGMRVTRELRVAEVNADPNTIKPLVYTSQPQRKPLSDEQIIAIAKIEGQKLALQKNLNIDIDFARAIEAAHGIKEKNTCQ